MPESHDVKESVARQFGAVAERYATSHPHAGGPDLDALIARARARAPKNVLDVACGAGHTALALAAAGFATSAVDLTPEMIEKASALAQERSLEIAFRQGDVEALPYPDASFDLVTTRLAAHHFPDPGAAVREMLRVLEPGGALLFIDVVSFESPTADSYLQTIETLRDPSHVRDHRADEWIALFEQAGAKAVECGRWGCEIGYESWLERMQTPEPERVALGRLIDQAPEEVLAALRIDLASGRDFVLPFVLLEAERAA